MGFMDKFSKILGGDKSASVETVKGPSATLRDHGIDPSNLKFAFNQDGSVGVSGHVPDQSECDRICEVIGEMPNVTGVKNNLLSPWQCRSRCLKSLPPRMKALTRNLWLKRAKLSRILTR